MNKRNLMLFIVIICIFLQTTACSCKHEWVEANCIMPQTCSLCGETEGETAPHIWQEATCTTSRICTVCAISEGAPAGHIWQEATCVSPKTCVICAAMEGSLADHVWQEDCQICTVCGMDERSVDEKFMDALAQGLEARWVLSTANEKADVELKADWEKYFLAEYEAISEFEDAAFKNANLGKWAKSYIDSIGASIEALAYYGTNLWTTKYSAVYHDRSVALYNIHKISPVPVSSEDQDKLIGILSNGEAVSMIDPLLNEIVFEKTEDSYGWCTYQAVVENTTTLRFSYFCLDIDLIDEDGVTIYTESAWVEYWEPGERIRFEFFTDVVFDEMDIIQASWDY